MDFILKADYHCYHSPIDGVIRHVELLNQRAVKAPEFKTNVGPCDGKTPRKNFYLSGQKI